MSIMFPSNYTALVCPQTPFQTESPLMVHAFSNNTSISDFLFGLFTFSNLGWLLLSIFLAANAKCLPFIWHIRLTNAFRFTCRSQRPKVEVGPEHLFKPMITVSSAPLMEIDLNMHKTNSSYFSDIDISRTHLICTLFSKGIEEMRGGTGAYTLSKAPVFGIALGAVSCSFKKEVKPYEAYEMWTRLLSWDEKWIYVVTHFVRKDVAKPKAYTLYPDQQNATDSSSTSQKSRVFDPKSDIFASAISKCVFKSGRRTVSPEVMLQASGLLPESNSRGSSDELEKINLPQGSEKASEWSMERVEEERQRGMQVAHSIATEAQQALEREFFADEILGRHRDGTGCTGLFSCFAQLAHVKKTQII